jgi:peptidoglycan/xylan/chitin deacetylase (PgdA/CDA1 family)
MFKRLLVLAVAMAIFVTTFFIYFHVADAQIEDKFRAERTKYHVDNTSLTASDTSAIPGGAATTALPATAGAVSAPAADSNAAPVNPNALIGPVPPATPPDSSTPAAPDNSATPGDSTPPTTAPASTPAAPSSTFIYPGLSRLPLALVGAYDTEGVRAPDTTTGNAPVSAEPVVSAPVAPMTASNSGTATKAEAMSPTATNITPEAPAKVASHSLTPVPSSVIVLGYHQFTGPGIPSKNIYSMRQDVFDQEMKYLKDNNYHVVPLSDVVRFVKHEIGLPPNSVAVTIDDGYKSAIVWAAPVLKKYGFPWTFFVYPDFVTVAEGKGAASWNDLLQLQADGVDIECHSKSHPILTKKGGKTPEQYDAWLTAETAGAKATLEQHMGKPIKFFAYPYGAYNKEVQAKVVDAGFEAVFTVANNPVHPTTDVHSIGRYIITTPVEKAFASYLRQGALAVADTTPAAGATISDPRPVITAVLGYAGNLDPATISTDVRDFGEVRHDFDPKTSTVRLYLPRDLIDSVVVVNIRAKDDGQTMIASWRFNYVPTAPGAAHAPIPGTMHASAPVAAPARVPTGVPVTPVLDTTAAPVAPVPVTNETASPSASNGASAMKAPATK